MATYTYNTNPLANLRYVETVHVRVDDLKPGNPRYLMLSASVTSAAGCRCPGGGAAELAAYIYLNVSITRVTRHELIEGRSGREFRHTQESWDHLTQQNLLDIAAQMVPENHGAGVASDTVNREMPSRRWRSEREKDLALRALIPLAIRASAMVRQHAENMATSLTIREQLQDRTIHR